ncbi:hemerythrin HHE cation binding domain-containing protein [Histoplasma capsulatum var. duboisii H88]|uniref:Hemerythrin HHE cation binding domain-containing protein n=1 Tax=Ajellomyces capsulatus (strain H88) TaxID=544711 RepID=F0UUQ8_AJEC8|nr:hemerythrin HHE cation binding domain-containing protein [Histoplasma capsulatum var. duboisii H88]QSS57532.1 hemerythrin HHE cation binding domain-containing protein [Histoplasma capsulatum var. duboisii H88]
MSKIWADTPMSLISETGYKERSDIPLGHFAITAAQNMAHLHNVIIRGFNSSYNQCLAVKPDTVDASDFLIYNRALYKNVKSHHDVEEEISFPGLAKLTGVEDIMDQNIQEHKDFEDGLEKFREYIFETDAKSYDGKSLQEVLDNLVPALHKHLVGEIPTLLDLAKYDSKKLEAWWSQTGKNATKNMDVFQDAPFMLGCMDSTFKIDGESRLFPPVPPPIKYLSKYVLQWRYSGAWRFSPCNAFGNPRPLAAPNPKVSKQ